ncbi:hypothetical protein GCM10022393_40100 [Aquimarina addita]|uniref:Calcineurin-like phosphoesterase domain-containing protein n=1 Tax=Aquimarina addita TaxID=870485 RepID=A0ABP6UW54_9FLAO
MYKIAQITDLHLDESYPFENKSVARKRLDIILKDIECRDISQVVCTGDIGENEGIEYFFKRLNKRKLSITLGNHDKFSILSKYYFNGINSSSKKIYRADSRKFYKYIYLDSSKGIIDDKQLLWLEKELKVSKTMIIFIHHPIIGLNLKVDAIGKLINQDKVINILTSSSNKITIYCGHYHMESHKIYKNITQFITPAVSFQIEKNIDTIEINSKKFGYRIIKLYKHAMSSEVIIFKDAN